MAFDWEYSIALAWVIGGFLLLLLLWQLYFIAKDSRISSRRKALRSTLNVLFIVAIASFTLQPTFPVSERNATIIVYSDEVEKEALDWLKNERDLRRAIPIERLAEEDLKLIAFGNQWTVEQLAMLNSREVEWVPLPEINALLDLKWKGILYQGEKQKIELNVLSSTIVILPIMDGEVKTDSIVINPGPNAIVLEVPVRTIGRNSWNLIGAGADTLHINFFSIERPPAAYLLLQSFPSVEFRVLAQWLGKQRNKVEVITQTSSDASSQVSINQADSSDILIADPSFVGDTRVAKILEKGGTVFFPIANPEIEIPAINRELQTSFSTEKLSENEKVRISENLDALPFSFEEKPSQKRLFDRKVAWEKVATGQVMLSMLSETFPIQFAGDSVRYNKVWSELTNEMLPPADINWQLDAPFVQNIAIRLKVNTRMEIPQILPQNEDSIYFQLSVVNPFTYQADFNFLESAWQSFADSLEVYVYSASELPSYAGRRQMMNFLKNHQAKTVDTQLSKKLPKAIWLAVLLILGALLWLEPKI